MVFSRAHTPLSKINKLIHVNMDEHFQIQPIKFLHEYKVKLKNMNSGNARDVIPCTIQAIRSRII
jgi:hypothetical protein